MVKIKVLFGEPFNTKWQDKTFKDENACIEWCRKNFSRISIINDYCTARLPITHFEIMDAIRGGVK